MNAVRALRFGEFVGHRRRFFENEGFAFAEIVHESHQHVPEHTHFDAHFIFIVSGEYRTAARDLDAPCGARTVIFNPPGTTHRDGFSSSQGRFLAVSLTSERFAQFRSAGGQSEEAVGFRAGQITSLAAQAYGELRHADPLAPLVLEGLALAMLGHADRRRRRNSRACPPWLLRAREMIADRYATGITLTEIAREVGVHPYHLARAYRQHLGRTPGDHLRACRIQRASELLQRTHHSLSDVAAACGFADQSQFTRSFKRATGVTPGVFRNDDWNVGSGHACDSDKTVTRRRA